MASSSIDFRPDFRHTEFSIEPYLKQHLRLKLDSDSTLCQPFATTGTCPLGASCPLRHVSAAPTNFQPPPPVPQNAHGRTVCKHWLRGLCKKGDRCDFLHEYHLRKMPECWFFAKYGFCSNGDECMYLHVTDDMRIRECPNYRKGFCKLGPECPLKHIRKVACPDYIAGFCSKGPDCRLGHPKFEPEPEPPSSSTRIPDVSGARFLPEATFRLHRKDWLDFAADPNHKTNFGGGGGGYTNYNQQGGGAAGGGAGGRTFRDLSTVECFKCGEFGHFANLCPNPAVPGDRGGLRKRHQDQN
ncbi:BZ3500_MvSof-1268-A1-R1_Chr2-2g04982 [Microbotryum saponariae]|uniref:mRNA 3'-end-processing protein n=1 Tax=Microbotryum saponariae TaxID=289078 RepID=A0A2X0LND8_9BASI|nr:BZ3500_MvSof-1268-A1-R1_Chr2-2g04982 [Microbotryum saponariae]SDA00633.1 BZ3501_MvSof-1269-A2-R1_Chr2-2g04656 [Microbotryum saponariae]